MKTTPDIRRSQRSECDQLHAMQRDSMRELGRACYDEAAIEAFITHVGTMESSLIDDGTFFSARIGGMLVGCGGWSTRIPAYESRMAVQPDQRAQPRATIRSIFVHPIWVCRGIARRVMEVVEQDIMAAGFTAAALSATLTGIPFYRQLGYSGQEPAVLRLPGDVVFLGLNMEKRLSAQRPVLAHAA